MKAELTPEQRETLFRAGDHDPLYCDCYEWEPEDEEPEQFCEALENTFETVAAMLAAAKAEALREAAGDVPLFEFMLVMDIASEVAPAQIAAWLRARADRIGAEQ